ALALLADAVKILHQEAGALVRHAPQGRDHALGALLLRQRAEAFDLQPVGVVAAADRRLARRQRDQIDVAEAKIVVLQIAQGELGAVAQKQKRIGFAARLENKMAGNVQDRIRLVERVAQLFGGKIEIEMRFARE